MFSDFWYQKMLDTPFEINYLKKLQLLSLLNVDFALYYFSNSLSSMPIMSPIKAYSFFKDILRNGDLQFISSMYLHLRKDVMSILVLKRKHV